MVFGGIAGSLGGAVQSGIKLSPSDLNKVIMDALTQPQKRHAKAGVQTFAEGPKGENIGRWGVAESNEGQISTDWEAIPGRMAGLLWWKKEYQTEARHIITINRSYRFSDLTNYSIATEVRERPNSNYQWAPGDPELGRESFSELKLVLLNSVRKWQISWRADTNED